MKNLAGNKEADKTILEELYLAGIPAVKVEKSTGEVPYTYVGKIGKWTFKRLWYYWSAHVEENQKGLPFDVAMELHYRKSPIDENIILGSTIRCGGHAGAPSPDEYGAQPIYNEELDEELDKLGYKKKYYEFLKKEFHTINVGEVSELYKEGKLTLERYVDSYHIDDQIGLNEFAKTLLNNKELII